MTDVVQVAGLTHRYGDRTALSAVSFEVRAGECFGLLGPNGGGKTTLFRILTTLLAPSAGTARICGRDIRTDRAEARRHIGVVFQSPSLDIYLTCRENLRHAGHLYGLSGRELHERVDDVLGRVGLADRGGDLVKTLSGGMKRRVEIAKGILHKPDLLILDEPSTGLDPGARRELWNQLQDLRRETNVSILITTHFMDEADKCDRLAILDRGALVAVGTPAELKARVGGECVTIECDNAAELAEAMLRDLNLAPRVVNGAIRVETTGGSALVTRLMERYSERVTAITLSKPTLEDVFMHETGHRFEIRADEGVRGAA